MNILVTGGTGALGREVVKQRRVAPDHKDGSTTFEQYLENRYPRPT
jgi:nucleoside-diphosphate-sugar epimerase